MTRQQTRARTAAQRPRRRPLRHAPAVLAQLAALALLYRAASRRSHRARLRAAQQEWAAAVEAGRRPSALEQARADGPLRGSPRLYLPLGGSWQSVDTDGVHTDVGQRAVLLAPGRLVLGSGPDADLRVDDPAVAAAHAEVVSSSRAVHLRDLVGTGVVRVDGVPVLDADLVDGNRVTVAGHDLVFRRDADPGTGRQGGEGS